MNQSENPERASNDAKWLITVAENTELKERVKRLENAIERHEDKSIERFAKYITIIFGVATGLTAVISALVAIYNRIDSKNAAEAAVTTAEKSKVEVKEAITSMRVEVRDAITNMQRQFELFAGEALKRPVLQILYEGKELTGQKIIAPANGWNPMKYIIFTNSGSKRTGPLSIKLHCSPSVAQTSTDWEKTAASSPEYPTCYTWRPFAPAPTISAGDTLALTETPTLGTLSNGACKLQVFFDGTGPVEAIFKVSAQ